jgi:hypothetical protein
LGSLDSFIVFEWWLNQISSLQKRIEFRRHVI